MQRRLELSDNKITQWNIAQLYEKGNGTEKNLEKAFYYYNKCAEQEDKVAINKIGEMYVNGLGIIQDSENLEDNSAFARGLTSVLVDSNRDLFKQGKIESIKRYFKNYSF